jgi:hypothetical protein
LLASLLAQVFVAAYNGADGSGKWAVDGGGTGMEVHLPTPPDDTCTCTCTHVHVHVVHVHVHVHVSITSSLLTSIGRVAAHD